MLRVINNKYPEKLSSGNSCIASHRFVLAGSAIVLFSLPENLKQARKGM
jgi:hypothetical protein